jgi:hypothetical protein
MGPSTAASKKVKSLPSNWTVFVMNPEKGIGNPFAPLRRGPDRLTFDVRVYAPCLCQYPCTYIEMPECWTIRHLVSSVPD